MRKEGMTVHEILETALFYKHSVSLDSIYHFGSMYEGTYLDKMRHDFDKVLVISDLEVVTRLQDCPETCLYLIQDDITPSGYCKLQLTLHGDPITNFHYDKNPELQLEIFNFFIPAKHIFHRYTDQNERLVVGHSYVNQIIRLSEYEIHGPALQTHDVEGYFDSDNVIAFQCRCLPKDAMEWFTRKRPHGWPPEEVIEKCKILGFLVVPVGHPNSQEKDIEWRISLSQQERLLVTMFNSVQLKCFVLMKVLKNEVINSDLKAKVLTSYHCKTCLLYMVESTPKEFWVPANLLKCLTACLEKLYKWAKEKYCPNYFIPAENMFDKLTGTDLELLKDTLSTLLSDDLNKWPVLNDVLFRLRTCDIGDSLRKRMHDYKCLPQEYIPLLGGDVDSGDSRLWNEIMRIFQARVSSQMRKYKFLCQLSLIQTLWTLRQIILIVTYDRDLKKVTENLRVIINNFESETRVTEHSEEETKAAVSLFVPFIKPTLLSNELTLQQRTGTPTKEILTVLTGETWHESNLPTDSAQLKKSCILYVLGYHHDSLDALRSIPEWGRFSICMCNLTKLSGYDTHEVLNRPDLAEDTTTKEVLWKLVSPCVPFLLTEAPVTPSVIMYECLRCLCLPAEQSALQPKEVLLVHEIACVDGRFLYDFLLYLNHSKMHQGDLAGIDILLMNAVVKGKIGNKASCLNILGWVLSREGLQLHALECFIKSIREEAERNTAYWHLLFLMSEPL